MSTPADVQATPAGYGERQAQPAADESSAGVMDHLSEASEKAVAEAIERADRGLKQALERIELHAEMEKTRLTAQHASIVENLRSLEHTIATRKSEVITSMDTFLNVTKNASIAAVELVPVAPERVPDPIEEHVSHLRPPTFLNRERQHRSVTPLRRIGSPGVFLAIAVLTMIGVGVGVTISQEPSRTIHALQKRG
jgi:hypothetical protein